jgi:uncharacterized membrane protein
MWIVPSIYVLGSIGLAFVVVRWDHRSPMTTSLSVSAASVSTALSALGSGMIAFTGFVISVVLLIVQFGSSQFSPRFLRWFRSEPTLKHAPGTFIATFLFALIATTMTGRGANDIVPYRTVFVSFFLALASIGWFLALVARTSDNLRVAHVIRRVDAQAREVFDVVYPQTHADVRAAATAVENIALLDPLQTLHHSGVGAILTSFDRRALVLLAIESRATIELVASVGDHVPTGGMVLKVYGPTPINARKLRTGLYFGDERTPEDDPAFTLRMLVDVAIKALSPAVNDPTTAVQALHAIEDVLRYASSRHLSIGVVTDDEGRARLIYPTPTWADLVSLALDEIRCFGAGQYQVVRRLRSLIEDLLVDLPVDRRPVLEAQLALLGDAVDASFSPAQRGAALVPDRQGLGLGRAARRATESVASDPAVTPPG